MFKFLSLQYKLNKVTQEELHTMVPRWITEEQYNSIIAG